MTTKTLQGFVHAHANVYGASNDDWMVGGFDLSVFRFDDMTVCGYTVVAPATITFEIPDNWDPRLAMVDVLRKEQARVRAEFQAKLNEIEDQINKYLAIGN